MHKELKVLTREELIHEICTVEREFEALRGVVQGKKVWLQGCREMLVK